MTTYIIRRLIMAVIVLLIVSIMVFLAMRLLPGDPIRMLVTQSESESFTEEQIAKLKHEFGLDRPLVIQYFSWLGGVFRGDLGTSILNRAPVSQEIVRRIPITFNIGIVAFIIGIVVGIPAGVICAIRRGTWVDTLITTMANIGITVPGFWLGFMLIYLFALQWKILPVMGYTPPWTGWPFQQQGDFVANVKQLVMPVTVLSLFPIASMARQTRSSMLEVMRQDYIRTAWSKGLRERAIIIKHALKNGLIPVITLSGMGLSILIGGTVIIETVFNIPGMGRLAVTSVLNQDYPYVQGIVLFVSAVVLLSNLLVDLAYGWLDPRIRYS